MAQHSDQEPGGVQPLLTRFGVARTGHFELPGRYCDERQVWVVDTADGPNPIIQSGTHLAATAELATKTDVQRERDDPGQIWPVELSTKTAHQVERDDVDPRLAYVCELITVTRIAPEQTDIG
jgi:hypothetical protein